MATVYYNGDILTMASGGEGPEYVECLVTTGDSITYTGDLGSEVRRLLELGDTVKVDLGGKSLLPGFIDPHIHPSMAALILSMDWITPFDWDLPDRKVTGVRTEAEYLAQLTSLVTSKTLEDRMILSWGYHHYYHGAISREVLDRVCPDKPLIVWHRSFHELFTNSEALRQIEFEDEDALKIHPQVDWDGGHFFEAGMENLLTKSTVFLTILERLEAGYKSAASAVHAGGITTIADLEFPMLDESIDFEFANNILKSPVSQFYTYCVPSSRFYLKMKGSHSEAIKEIRRKSKSFSDSKVKMFPDHVKVIGDGAFFSQLMQMKDGYLDGHEGEWFTTPEVTEATMREYWAEGFQIHVHTNGDLAMELVLNIVETLSKEAPRPDHRTTIEHAGFFTEDQAHRLKRLGCLVSAQPYYHYVLADKYSEIGLGPERAKKMCPLGLLERLDIKMALHSDFTMAPAQPLTLAWCAVNRVTLETGQVNHADLCISPYTAIRGVTLSAAEILGIETRVGSLEVGKEANLVILDENPLKVDKIRIKDVRISARIFRGEKC